MCLILFAHRMRDDLPLVLLANRDEFLGRATAAAAPWPESPWVLGGRDLVAGGSWLGVAADGRWAAITNVREGESPLPGGPSRGWLVRDYLQGNDPPQVFAGRLTRQQADYAGYNLLLGNNRELWYLSNRGLKPRRLLPGIYGLSNGRLDTPWPKVVRGKAALRDLLVETLLTPEQGFRLLANRETFADEHLPVTGVSLEWERALSAAFIVAPERSYGTRSSTVLMRTAGGEVLLAERTFAGSPESWAQRCYRWPFGDSCSGPVRENTCSTADKIG